MTRFAHSNGFYVERRFGWDTHGLPVEHEIDKKLGITSKADVLALGIDKYNAECRAIVMRYSSEWRTTVERLGRWIDFDNDYKTLNTPFMESVWWVFSQLWKKNLVYKGLRVMPYTTGCTTPLSNFEAGLEYRDVQDPAGESSPPSPRDDSLMPWPQLPSPSPSSTIHRRPFSHGRPLPGLSPPTSPAAYTLISPTSRSTTRSATPTSSSVTSFSQRCTRTPRRRSRRASTKSSLLTRELRWLAGSTFPSSTTTRTE